MNSYLPILKKEFLEIYRSKKMLVLIILFAFVAIASPVFAKLIPTLLKNMPATPGLVINLPEPTWRDSIDQFVKNLAQFGLIVIILLFSGSIAEEKNKKTLEMVLTKPVSRIKFLLAKFAAAGFFVKLTFIVSAIAFYAYTVSIFGSFPIVNFIWLCLFLLIFLLLTLAVTLFFSATAKSQVSAAALAFFVSIIFTTLVDYIKALVRFSPDYTLVNYKHLIESGNYKDFLPSAITSIALITILIVAAIYLFRRQEIER